MTEHNMETMIGLAIFVIMLCAIIYILVTGIDESNKLFTSDLKTIHDTKDCFHLINNTSITSSHWGYEGDHVKQLRQATLDKAKELLC